MSQLYVRHPAASQQAQDLIAFVKQFAYNSVITSDRYYHWHVSETHLGSLMSLTEPIADTTMIHPSSTTVLHNRRHHHLGSLHRSKAHKPRMGQAIGNFRRAGLPRYLDAGDSRSGSRSGYYGLSHHSSQRERSLRRHGMLPDARPRLTQGDSTGSHDPLDPKWPHYGAVRSDCPCHQRHMHGCRQDLTLTERSLGQVGHIHLAGIRELRCFRLQPQSGILSPPKCIHVCIQRSRTQADAYLGEGGIDALGEGSESVVLSEGLITVVPDHEPTSIPRTLVLEPALWGYGSLFQSRGRHQDLEYRTRWIEATRSPVQERPSFIGTQALPGLGK